MVLKSPTLLSPAQNLPDGQLIFRHRIRLINLHLNRLANPVVNQVLNHLVNQVVNPVASRVASHLTSPVTNPVSGRVVYLVVNRHQRHLDSQAVDLAKCLLVNRA